MLQILLSLLCVKYIFILVLLKRSIRSKERLRTCKDYVIGTEITTVLKIAEDSLILEL